MLFRSLNLNVVDTGEHYFIKRRDGVLLYSQAMAGEPSDATVTCTRLQFLAILLGRPVPGIVIEGDPSVLDRLTMYVNPGNKTFNLIEP